MKETVTVLRAAYCVRELITQYVLRITLGLILLVGVACQSPSANPSELRLTGVIEGTQVEVVAEVGARMSI